MSRKLVRGIISIVGALSALTSLVADWEGEVPKTYLDIAKVPTACYGHTGPEVNLGHTYTHEQCLAWLHTDVGKSWEAVTKYVKVPITLNEHIAFADFIYNLGEVNFAHSTLLKKLNAGDHVGACRELLRWDKAVVGGKLQSVPGLTARRQVEAEYCMEGL